ncbi:hypothetical protein B0J14DRAFT_704225 [Halenospora varia]|nr:hypothetical protein B0J14DRAFT_704225 [Halenospora varia]
MYSVGRLIQQLNNYDKELTLEALLEKKEFASLLHGIYTSLPVKSKSTAQRIFRTTDGTKKKKTRSAALTAVLEIRVIALPQDIHNLFQTWKENPSQFWKACGAQLGTLWDSEKSVESVATEAYLAVRHLRVRRLWDTILWRFYANFFYNLALLLGNGQSEKITDEIAVIEGNLRSWTAAGSRYHKICLRLDKGALFLLPQVPDNVWEDEHSLKGTDFDLAMAHLKRQGIMELSDQLGADNLSSRILNFALDPFRWDVTLSVPAPGTSNADGCGPSTGVEPGTPGGNSNSIGALLNAAEHIAAATQGQQLSSVRRSSIADRIDSTSAESLVPEGSHPFAAEGVLHGSGWDATASGQPEIRSDGGESRGLEPQGEALDPPRKRMRVDSFPRSNENRGSIVTAEAPAGVNLQAGNVSSLDSSVSQPSGGPISDHGGTTEETSPGDTNSSVLQAQDDHQVEASETNIAMMAEVDKLETTLGGYLFKGMNTSRMRKGEKDGGRMTFTDTVLLHLAYQEGEDFKLEVWLCSSIGKAISQAKMRSVEDLRNMLGDYLFGAMKASNRRKDEERKGVSDCTVAIDVSFPNGDDGSDCKVEVMLNFGIGIDVYANIYPRVG